METYLLEARDLPPYLWDGALNFDSYIHNIVPHKSVVGVTSFEALMVHKPNVSHLRFFGSKGQNSI